MVGNEEGRVNTEIEKNPAQGSNLKVPNTKVILFCVAAFLLIVAYILMSAMFQGQKRNAEDSSVKKGTSFSTNDAESIIGGREDHPRSCGNHVPFGNIFSIVLGSPPLMREPLLTLIFTFH